MCSNENKSGSFKVLNYNDTNVSFNVVCKITKTIPHKEKDW